MRGMSLKIVCRSWQPCRRHTTRSPGNADWPYFGSSAGRPKRSQRAVRDLVVGPLRHDVVIPQQHAIERLGRGDQVVAALGENHPFDQLVDRGILDSDDVARPRHVGSLRAPELALLVARRKRFRPRRHDDIEIPASQPVLILRRIDGAHADVDAETFQRGLEEQHRPVRKRDRRQAIRSRMARRSCCRPACGRAPRNRLP